MTSYRFYLDEKCTVWVRTYFTVEAPDRDTAASCAARIAKSDLHDTQRSEDGIAIGQKQPCFIIRDTSEPGGSWRIASGEFYEPSFEISDEATLILCNHKWEEHLRVGNDRNRFPVGFPTLQEACREAWNNFSAKPTRLLDTPDFWRWFAPYLPPELPSWEQDNWRDNNRQTVEREILSRFDFCGNEMAIVRITERHTECGLTWRMYFADWAAEDRSSSYVWFFGYEVGNDNRIYTKRG